MSSSIRPALVAVLFGLPLLGCDKIVSAIEKQAQKAAADAVQTAPADANAPAGGTPADAAGGQAPSGAAPAEGESEDDKLGAKLDGYVQCINMMSPSVQRSADRYADWVDMKKGPTGKERYISYGMYELFDPKDCLAGIEKSNAAEPKDPELETAAAEYSKALQELYPTVQTAAKYYDEEDYKDDGAAKGKELHPKLSSGFDRFFAADKAMRERFATLSDGLQARELERIEKEEGRKVPFQARNVMSKAKAVMKLGDVPDWKELDLESFKPALEAYEAALQEAETYTQANKAEADSVSFGSFLDDAAEFRKAGKSLRRRKEEKKEYSNFDRAQLQGAFGADGSPQQLLRIYNDLVNASNQINWHWYKPNG